MAETFDVVTTASGTGGANLAGDTFTQSATSKFVPACYLVYGAAGGPYERVDTSTGLPVNVVSGTVGLNAEYADDADWTDSTSKHVLTGGLYQSTPQTITDGDVGPFQVTSNGYLIVSVGAGSVTANAGTDLNTSALALETGGNLAGAATSLAVIDDWDETNRCAVNLIASQVAITGGAGAVAANTPRVTLASDDPAVASLSVLDDWDETNRCAVNPISGQAGVAAGAGAVGATTQRVTLASDDPAVAKLGTIDTDTGNIATSCALLDNTVYVDDGDWTDGVSSHQLVGGLYQSSPQSITDGDVGPLQVTANGYLIVSLASAQTLATVTNVATIGTSVTPGTGAAHLGKAEDAAHSSGDTGVMALAVRNDTHTTAISGTDGDYTPLAVDSSGKLGIRGTFAEDAAHTSGDLGHFVLAVANSTHTSALSGTDGDYTPIAVDTTGKVGIRGTFAEDSAHTSGDLGLQVLTVRQDTAAALAGTDADYQPLITDSSGRLHVNVGSMTPGTAATSLGKAVDSAAGATDTGVAILAVRDDALASLTPVEGDYNNLRVDANGALWVLGTSDVAMAASLSVMDDWDNAASDGCSVSGDVAHDAADAGEPVKVGMKAVPHGATPTEVAESDRTNWYANRAGVPFVMGGHPNVKCHAVLVTDGNGAQTDQAMFTVAAGTKIVVTRLTIVLDGLTTAETNIRVGFGTSTLTTPNTSTAGTSLLFEGTGFGSAAGGGGNCLNIGDGSGIIGVGADGAEIRYTVEDPTGGNISISVSYYEVSS